MIKSAALALSVLAFTTLVAFAACTREPAEPKDGSLTIVTTIYPLTFMAEQIGGDRVDVIQLVKPGVEAHDFEPAPSDIRAISNANLFFYNHPAFEGWALAAASASGSGSGDGGQVVAVQTVMLDSGRQDSEIIGNDPHVWLNPLEAQKQAGTIVDALVIADPDGAAEFVRNGDSLRTELLGLDDQIESGLANCALDTVVVSHLAYGHMAERYGFDQVGLAGLSPESESGPSHIASAIERMGELGIRHILQEPIVDDRLANTVAEETGADILVLHPLEVRTADEVKAGEDYISIMSKNAEILATALNCT